MQCRIMNTISELLNSRVRVMRQTVVRVVYYMQIDLLTWGLSQFRLVGPFAALRRSTAVPVSNRRAWYSITGGHTVINRTHGTHKDLLNIFAHFYKQYLVLFTTVPRNSASHILQ